MRSLALAFPEELVSLKLWATGSSTALAVISQESCAVGAVFALYQ